MTPPRLMNPHRVALLSTGAHLSDFSSAAVRTANALHSSAHAGTDTARALAEQRESLMKQRGLLQLSSMESGDAGRAMRRMQWRLISDKAIAWTVVVLQIGLFCLIGYVKYMR